MKSLVTPGRREPNKIGLGKHRSNPAQSVKCLAQLSDSQKGKIRIAWYFSEPINRWICRRAQSIVG